MRLDDIDPTGNINDQGSGGGGGFNLGGGGGGMGSLIFGLLPLLLGRKMGCGTIALLLGVGALYLYSSGGLSLGSSGVASEQSASGGTTACDTQAELFACKVFTSTEATWSQIFADAGQRYQPAKLEFYQDGGQCPRIAKADAASSTSD